MVIIVIITECTAKQTITTGQVIITPIIITMGPVSYTHLDVYKRQGFSIIVIVRKIGVDILIDDIVWKVGILRIIFGSKNNNIRRY